MHLAQQGAGRHIGVEPPLAEADHLWLDHLRHKHPGLQETSYSSGYILIRSDAGEIREGVVRATWEGIVRTAGREGVL